MEESKLLINVGITKFPFEIEKIKFSNHLKKMASHIKYLDSPEYLQKTENELYKTQKYIKGRRTELIILNGFFQAASEMQKRYEIQFEVLKDAYHKEIVVLERICKSQSEEIKLLEQFQISGIQTEEFLIDQLTKHGIYEKH